MSRRLAGKLAIVTGATGGIGSATARRPVADRALVILGSRSNESGEAPAAAELSATFVQTDLLDEDGPDRLVEAASSARAHRPSRQQRGG